MKLEDIRKDIDAVDKELVPLLKKRMECSLKVAEIKANQGLAVYHPKREEEILDKVTADGGEFGTYIASVYREIMGVSREAQQIEMNDSSALAGEIVNAKNAVKENVVIACQGNRSKPNPYRRWC